MKLEEIQKLCDESSSEDWHQYVHPEKKRFEVRSTFRAKEIAIVPYIKDAKFIAHSRQIIPMLLNDRKRLVSAIHNLRARLSHHELVDSWPNIEEISE